MEQSEKLLRIDFYVKSSTFFLKIIKQDDYDKKSDKEKIGYNKEFVVIRSLTWGEIGKLQNMSTVPGVEKDTFRFDSDLFCKLKLTMIIHEWSFTSEENTIAPIDQKNVDALHPEMADFILREYNKVFEYTQNKKQDLLKAIRKYYLSQSEFDQGIGEVAAPKPVVDVMLSERFHWTPQQIDDIPKYRIDEYMLVLNCKTAVDQEIRYRKNVDKEKEMEQFGKGGVRKKIAL